MVKCRKKIPRDMEVKILFINDMTCCICREREKGVQIHHIDENPSNNNLSNLAVVCINCHDKIHKSGGVTKGISPDLLKGYKYDWESFVRKQRTQRHSQQKSSLRIEKTLFEFEIRKTILEIAALENKNIDGIKQRLDFLYTLYLLEGYTGQILRNLNHIVAMIAFDEIKACLITDKIHEFFYHLFGPRKSKIKKEDIDNLKIAIEMIGTIGHFSAEFEKSFKVVKSVSIAYENIWELLIYCDLEAQALTVLNQLNEISKACKIVYEDEEPLTLGINQISQLRKKLKMVTTKEEPEWKRALKRLKNY